MPSKRRAVKKMRNGEDWSQETFVQAEKAIGYAFQNKALLKSCFTHKSFSNVHSSEKDNERLEFLGDAVLGFCVSESLYLKSDAKEGELTTRRKNYVSRAALEEATERAGLMRFLRYSGGENNVGGKTASNLFEAVVAAIYLDGGMKAARKFLARFLTEIKLENYKSVLQEYVQAKKQTPPVYEVKEENEKFICTVSALGKRGEGRGESKQSAEQAAAKALYEILR